MKRVFKAAVLAAILFAGIIPAEAISVTTEVYRLYNPNSGEHFYTENAAERDVLRKAGWYYEGVGWYAETKTDIPVYRLYNKNGGEHHYTTSVEEKKVLTGLGWKDEGIAWYSSDSSRTPLYRQYDPNAFSCNHNYTTNKKERDALIRLGWKDEGIAWYGFAEGHTDKLSADDKKAREEKAEAEAAARRYAKYKDVAGIQGKMGNVGRVSIPSSNWALPVSDSYVEGAMSSQKIVDLNNHALLLTKAYEISGYPLYLADHAHQGFRFLGKLKPGTELYWNSGSDIRRFVLQRVANGRFADNKSYIILESGEKVWMTGAFEDPSIRLIAQTCNGSGGKVFIGLWTEED